MDYQDSRIGFLAGAPSQQPAQQAPAAGAYAGVLPPADAYRAVLSGRWSPAQFEGWVRQVAQAAH